MKTLPVRLKQNTAKVLFQTYQTDLNKVAAFLQCDPNDFQFIANTAAALSAIVKSFTWRSGDVLVYFSIDSEANKKIFKWVQKYNPVRLVEVLCRIVRLS